MEVAENFLASPKAAWVGIAIGIASIFLCLFYAHTIARRLSRWLGITFPTPAVPAIGVTLCFLTFVALGLSGSSLKLTEGSLSIKDLESNLLAGKGRAIRSDEWLVLSPMAIGQTRHEPAFPIVNKNLGPDGQNMLIVGMTSVPVWGLPALGRPATWGYFFLPLPQALAWHWWFPIFGGILGLWACFIALLHGHWRMSFALSLSFILSPYAVAWSYWPAYVTMFSASTFAATIALLKTKSHWSRLLFALLIGISSSGFILTLYPAWQIPLAYLFLLLLAAVLIRDRNSLQFSATNFAWIALGLIFAGAILAAWWIDARNAVATMVATVYPGQRTAIPGGGTTFWYLAQGFTNFKTLYADLKGASNQSEISSFFYFTLPAIVAAITRKVYLGKNKSIFYALVAFLAIGAIYQFFGFPVEIAKLTLWGRTFPHRVDIAIGFASIALIGVVFSSSSSDNLSHRAGRVSSGITALAWTSIIWWCLKSAPAPVVALLDLPTTILLLALVAGCSYTLAAKEKKKFFVALLTFTLLTSIAFNPWIIFTEPTHPRAHIADSCESKKGRVLVIGSQIPAMTLMASGCQVMNGVFYYPQPTVWHSLDPSQKQISTYNRYQHLIFDVADLGGTKLATITSPQADIVNVKVDSRKFDFTQLPISFVLVKATSAIDLHSNITLRKITTPTNDWEIFEVIR